MSSLGPSTSVLSTQELLRTSTLISQGAEAKVYKAYLQDRVSDGSEPNTTQHSADPVLLKYRFQKQYRHPSLDGSLTRARIAGEARALMRCLRSGVKVPGIRMVDATGGVLGVEWVDGKNVRMLLPGGAEPEDAGMGEDEPEPDCADAEEEEEVDPLGEYGISRDALMGMIGTEIAKMHLADIIHGDLTTSNMMLRRGPNDLVLIDFGLSYHSALIEDKAVDLYVLERAFASTHPDSEPLFASVLAAYGARMGNAQWSSVKKRLDDVRLRGRKRSMVG
ncbi:kinase-like protein [Leucogyrophana mollusca]|uniref:Kinase-like protein n=1 Tax=Leucogyrophana mollusca TaxID=85980 RepID=A0ACB8BLL6_9AGAM|nr:kinase-like protein [Leucogyrophana mollusca]